MLRGKGDQQYHDFPDFDVPYYSSGVEIPNQWDGWRLRDVWPLLIIGLVLGVWDLVVRVKRWCTE